MLTYPDPSDYTSSTHVVPLQSEDLLPELTDKGRGTTGCLSNVPVQKKGGPCKEGSLGSIELDQL